MTLAAFLLTWIGAGLIALGSLVLTWYDGSTLFDLSEAAIDNNSLELSGAPSLFVTIGWYWLLGLIVAFGLFAMFSGPKDKWIAFVGHLLLAGGIGYGSYLLWTTSDPRTDLVTRLAILGYAVAALSVLGAVAAITRLIWAGALLTLVLALAGAVLSIWLIATGVPATGDSFSILSWTVPLGFIVVIVGSLVSVAVNGKNRTEHPQAAKQAPAGGIGATPATWGASESRF